MAQDNELQSIKDVDAALSALTDPAARDRVLQWAWDKYSSKPIPTEKPEIETAPAPKATKRKKRKKRKKSEGTTRKKRKRPSILKGLNLRPKDNKSFKDFASEKLPSSQQEQCVVAIYYLKHTLNEGKITADHVHTCFKDAGWRLPANLHQRLAYVASQKGWLDTSSMDDIRLTPAGENLVVHDLPAEKGEGKKAGSKAKKKPKPKRKRA